MPKTDKIRYFLLIFLISTCLSVLFDIPFLRQLLGFIFLAFVPGALILCIINLERLEIAEKFVLSIGLSISFIMFSGLLINFIYPLFSYKAPLSITSLIISLTIVILILAVIASNNDRIMLFFRLADLKIDTKSMAVVLTSIIFPILSIFGMHLMNTKNNNIMLIILLLLIPAYIIIVTIWNNNISEKAYPLMILFISISLVLLWGMRTSHIIGSDSHLEYYFFMQTLSNERWQIIANSTIDSCLSVSILPVTYQSFLNINPEFLFKILYPLLFFVSPLVIYIISKKYLSSFYAFLASVLFMSQSTFLTTSANSRTVVGILFFALTIMVWFTANLQESKKRFLMLIFIASCTVSHYSTTYIFFIILLFSWAILIIIQKIILYSERFNFKRTRMDEKINFIISIPQSAAPYSLNSYLTVGLLLLFFVIIFVWYSQATGAAFKSGLGFFVNTIYNMQDLFILESRQENIVEAFGFDIGDSEIPRKITWAFSWLTIIFIAIGVLSTLVTYRKRIALTYGNVNDSSCILKNRIDIAFFVLAVVCSGLMMAMVILPYVSRGYGIFRAFAQIMVILSLFFIIGVLTSTHFFHFNRINIVILMILIPYFMCTSGTMSQMLGVPQQIALNSQGEQYDLYYIYDQEVSACKWLSKQTRIYERYYADFAGHSRLISQGGIRIGSIGNLVNFLEQNQRLNGYIYLRYFNVVSGKLIGATSAEKRELSEYCHKLNDEDKIYDCGGSEIWR